MTSANKSYLDISNDGVPGRDDLGDQKEIVARGAYFHVERMDDGCVWMGFQVGRDYYHLNFYAIKKGLLRMRLEPNLPAKGK